jgi:hypothetical protein
MPARIRRLRFRFQHRGRWYDTEITHHRLMVGVDDAEPRAVPVEIYGHRHTLEPGGCLQVEIEPSAVTRCRPAVAAGDERRVALEEGRLAGAST